MLTYDIIIKYLMPVVNTFSLHPNIILKSSDFTFFNKIFDETFYRYGINTLDSENISLISSILFCIDDNYNNIAVNQMKNIITIESNVKDCVKELNINIIIFDFKNNKISSEYFGDYFNPWRPTILLANYDDYYEPIITKECKIFSFTSYKSNILKNNILNQPIYKYNTEELININDNFKEILEIENLCKKSDKNLESNDLISNEIFTSFNEDIPNRNKLDRMKKDELLLLCNKLNKPIVISRPTKKDLIELILNS